MGQAGRKTREREERTLHLPDQQVFIEAIGPREQKQLGGSAVEELLTQSGEPVCALIDGQTKSRRDCLTFANAIPSRRFDWSVTHLANTVPSFRAQVATHIHFRESPNRLLLLLPLRRRVESKAAPRSSPTRGC
jgi:hypothetical protein